MNEKKSYVTRHKIYPIFVLLCLLLITYLFLEFSNWLIIFIAIPLIIGHSNPTLLLKEILKRIGIGSDFRSINGQFSDYKLFIDEILEKNNFDYDAVIVDAEKINLYMGKSTIYISKGFVEYWFKLVPLNEREGNIKILSLLGHELAHQQEGFLFIKELFKAFIVLLVFNILFLIITSFSGIYNTFVTYYILFLSFCLILFYVFRKIEFMADKEGVNIAKDNTGIILFLRTVDDSVKKGYKLWDKFYELFSFHPHSIKRIEKIEKLIS